MPIPHPRNRDFQWRPSQPPYARLTDDQAERYDADGFFLFENAFTEAEIDTVVDAIAPLEQAEEERLRKPGGRIFCSMHPMACWPIRAGPARACPRTIRNGNISWRRRRFWSMIS